MKFLIFYLLIMVAMVASYLKWVPGKVGFLVFAVGLLLASVWFFWGMYRWFWLGDSSAQQIVLTQCLMPAGLFWFVLSGWGTPMINDISTDLTNPPNFEHIEFQLGKTFPDKNIEIIKKSYPRLTSLTLNFPTSKVFDAVVELIGERAGWEIINQEFERGRVEISTETALFRFTDDVIVRVQSIGDSKTKLDMRSKSRFGKGDKGVNAKRILIFYEGITKKLQKN